MSVVSTQMTFWNQTRLLSLRRVQLVALCLFVIVSGFREVPAFANPVNIATECGFPMPKDDVYFVVIGAGPGATVSSVALDDVSKVTTLIDVALAPSSKPVFLVIDNGSDVIWRIESEAEIAHVVLINSKGSKPNRAGVLGVSSDKITFVSDNRCGRIRHKDSLKSVQKMFGREADQKWLKGRVSVRSFHIDKDINAEFGLNVRELTSLFSRQERQFVKDYPGGVAMISAEDVVAPDDVVAYPILPGSAGLIQLLRDGAVSLATESDTLPWQEGFLERFATELVTLNKKQERFEADYVVHAPIFLPIDVQGRFLVERGVPAPVMADGAPRACIFMMDGFTAFPNRCYPTDRNVMVRLMSGGAIASRLDCRIKADYETSTQLSVIQLSYGKGARRQMSVGKVHVTKPGRHLLVLVSDLDAVTWHVEASSNSEIAAILTPARHTVIADGLADEAVFFQAADGPSYVPAKPCSAFTLLLDPRKSGAHVRLLQNSVLAYTGKSFQEILTATPNEKLIVD